MSTDHPAIRVKNLGKKYTLGGPQEQYLTLRDAIVNSVMAPFRRFNRAPPDEGFWALKDVTFDVEQGEVVGIIGRNGAGKSTLLKILSRITAPTEGTVELHGRVGSLLEVGTGFHPEMTGRENIFLNGSILGMKKSEIEQKFDEIVKFAEIDKFIDTPVKRYSSGMYVRLAFAVAAHLEPEILLIDEVLAVGDYDFQNKCLGKMKSIADEKRTVLFVSHNMSAVQNICKKAILLEKGKVSISGEVSAVIGHYLSHSSEKNGEKIWSDFDKDPVLDNTVKFRAIRALDADGKITSFFKVYEPITIELEYEVIQEKYALNVHLYFKTEFGEPLFVSMDNNCSPWQKKPNPVGHYKFRCVIPGDLLNEGRIRIEYLICTRPSTGLHATENDAISLFIIDDKNPKGVRGNWVRDWPQSLIRPRLKWTVEYFET